MELRQFDGACVALRGLGALMLRNDRVTHFWTPFFRYTCICHKINILYSPFTMTIQRAHHNIEVIEPCSRQYMRKEYVCGQVLGLVVVGVELGVGLGVGVEYKIVKLILWHIHV